MLDAGAYGEERAGDVIAIGKIVLGDNRRGLLVVHVRVGIFLFELAQRFDAVVREDD